jgi:hypothetical protein
LRRHNKSTALLISTAPVKYLNHWPILIRVDAKEFGGSGRDEDLCQSDLGDP